MTNISAVKNRTELFGIALKVLSGIAFALMSGLIKYLGSGVPLGQVVFFRSTVALIPLVIYLLLTSEFPKGLKTKNPWGHVKRCILGTAAMFLAFGALRYLPIAETTAISYLSPIVLVILAMYVLKEYVAPRRWFGVLFGIAGLAVMTVPNFSAHADANTLVGISLALGSAILIATALLQIRQLTQMGENPGTIAFYFALTSSTIGAAAVLIGGWRTPTMRQLIALIGIGFLGGIAQILMTTAFKYAEASAMAPYDYLSIVWAVIIGVIAFSEIPGITFWIAMPLIILGAIIAKPK